ncbi:hypothetical protein ACT5GY_00645 [Lactiplantibacillus plantarum]
MPANFYQRLIDKYEPMTEAAFLVLVSVRQPITSEAIPAKIAEMTNNQLQLGLGTLFTNLHAMTKDYLMTERVDKMTCIPMKSRGVVNRFWRLNENDCNY